MAEQDATDLKVRTKEFALRVIRLYCSLPKREPAQVLGRQVLRSGTSVGANWREASRARSNAEFVAKTGDCLKELEETHYWLELLTESGEVKMSKLAALLDEASQLTAIFTTIERKVRGREKT